MTPELVTHILNRSCYRLVVREVFAVRGDELGWYAPHLHIQFDCISTAKKDAVDMFIPAIQRPAGIQKADVEQTLELLEVDRLIVVEVEITGNNDGDIV